MCVCAGTSYYGLLWCIEVSPTCESNLDQVYGMKDLVHRTPLRIPSMVFVFVNALIVTIVGSIVDKVFWQRGNQLCFYVHAC